MVVEDRRLPWTPLPQEAAPVKMRKMQYDDLYRLTQVDYDYDVPGGIAPWQSPFEAETAKRDTHPIPLRALKTRVRQQGFNYDGLGNIISSTDDLSARFDGSLGPTSPTEPRRPGPNQLRSGGALDFDYDPAGNLAEMKVVRQGDCPTGNSSQCAQWFAYDWDEVGQLARARRWDFDGNKLPTKLSSHKPSWDLVYTYSDGARVLKSKTDEAGAVEHTIDVFDTLKVDGAKFEPASGNYRVQRDDVHAYLGENARSFGIPRIEYLTRPPVHSLRCISSWEIISDQPLSSSIMQVVSLLKAPPISPTEPLKVITVRQSGKTFANLISSPARKTILK